MDGFRFTLSEAIELVNWLKIELADQHCAHCGCTYSEHAAADHLFDTSEEEEIAN